MHIDYMAALGQYFPTVTALCFGDANVYENIQWEGGDPLPTKEQLDAALLQHTKKIKIAELSDACQQDIVSGFTSSALGTPAIYDAYEVDQLNLVGATSGVAPLPNYPDGFTVEYAVRPIVDGVTQPKVYLTHTYAQLRTVLSDGVNYKLSRLQKFNTKRDYVNNNCTTIAEVDAVTWVSMEPTP